MQDLESKIADYLTQCAELAHLTDKDGWLESNTIAFEIVRLQSRSVIIAVRFVEIVLASSGVCTDRVDRFGQMRLDMDEFGEIVRAQVL